MNIVDWLKARPYAQQVTGQTLAVVAALLLAGLLLSSCAPVPPVERIATHLMWQLRGMRDWPLSVQCQAIKDAQERCVKAGLPRECYGDGWRERTGMPKPNADGAGNDYDGWTQAVCRQREERP